MTVPRDPDRLIRAFLEEGPTALSHRTIDRTLGEIHRSHRRAGIGPRRNTTVSRPVIAAIAAAVVIAAAALFATRSNEAVGGPPSPSPGQTALSVVGLSPTPTVAASDPGPHLGARSGTIVYQLVDPVKQTAFVYSLSAANPSPTPRTLVSTDSCCLVLASAPDVLVFGISAAGGRATSAIAMLDGSLSAHPDTLGPIAGVDDAPGAVSSHDDIALEGWGTTDPRKNGIYVSVDNGGGSMWGDIRRVTSPTGGIHDVPIAFSPDGSRILFIRANHGQGAGDLYTVGLDGSNVHKLNPSGVYVETTDAFGPGASYSPDGSRVAFAGFRADATDGSTSIYVVGATSGTAKAITDEGIWSTSARWSPDGTWIAFDKAAGSPGHEIFLVHPDGSGLKSITAGIPTGFCCSQWSPDGSALLVQGATTSSDIVDLYLVAVDGSGVVQITHAPGRYNSYAWSPVTP